MFYSNSFLARKGPLGTVWCAAHLQNRLKRPHYDATNIPKTVERIMYPELPLALRMSGHLLLGVVRIYSKKVDYFCQDCKHLLFVVKKAYTSPDINLPENATHATLESITLPDNFQLDVMDIEDNFDAERSHDHHLRSLEEITIEDQIPIGQDPYIVVTFDDDVATKSSSESGAQQMQEGSNLHTPVRTTAGVQEPGVSNRAILEDISTSIPEIEVMRDAAPEYQPEDIPFLSDPRDDKLEPDNVAWMEIIQENENRSPEMELIPSQQRIQPFSAASEQEPLIHESHNATVARDMTPELVIRSTPPAEQPKQRPKRRRQQHYDELTVLSNKYMKQRLENSSDILRTRKQCPCSALSMWKMNNRLKKDTLFLEPIATGICNDLRDAFDKDFVSAKPYLALVEGSGPAVAESSRAMQDSDMEIERLRNYEIPTESNVLHDLINSPNRAVPSPTNSMPSPTRRDDYTPAFDPDRSLWSEQAETTIGTKSDLGASTGCAGSDMETPLTMMEEQTAFGNTRLSDIPELVNSADGDLSFLAEDDNTPAGSQGTPDDFSRRQSGASEVDMLSVRSRAVAKFLKSRLSVTPLSERPSEDLSLNKILEGKRKKISARMVFETLVLKNCGLVDLQQDEPYGEITLKPTPKLSKEQFCS